jgi:hypothetical protein
MHSFLPSNTALPSIVVLVLMIIVGGCTPAPVGGTFEVQPTQTTAPDFDREPLATLAAGTATAVASDGVEVTPIQGTWPVDTSIVGPITATFFQERQTTEYEVEVGAEADIGSWATPSCGTALVDVDGLKMAWTHAHPPCDETTSHGDEKIEFTVRVPTHEGVWLVYCEYDGASPGTGKPCEWAYPR